MSDGLEDLQLLRVSSVNSCWRRDISESESASSEILLDASDEWALWLVAATVLERLALVASRKRASYARRTQAVWQSARTILGAARFDAVGAAMNRWRNPAPALPDFREVLWAVEQMEAAGGLWLSGHSLLMLRSLVDESDVRAGYAMAQLGRVLRSMGRLDGADAAFAEASRIGVQHSDNWLRARALLGCGVVRHTRGNYPAAQKTFADALRLAALYPDLLLGAHIGIVSVALSRRDYDSAISHAWGALCEAGDDTDTQAELLAMFAEICIEVGHYTAALTASENAFRRNLKRQKRPFLLRTWTAAAMHTGDALKLMSGASLLAQEIPRITNPWEKALCLVELARVKFAAGVVHEGEALLARASDVATRHGFHEIEWMTEAQFPRSQNRMFAPDPSVKLSALNVNSSRVLDEIAELRLPDVVVALR